MKSLFSSNGLTKYLDNSQYGAHRNTAKAIFLDNPLFGVGIKNFRVESYDKKYRIKNSKYNYRIFGVDFNKNLSFKYKNTSYLYQGAKHWKKEEKEVNLID